MKIFNTVFNSFWRTLGRILCYILIGFIIAFIIGKTKVNASVRSDNFLQNIKYLPSYVQAYNWSGPNSYTAIDPVKHSFGDLYPSLFNSEDKLLFPVFNSGSEIFSISGPLGSNGRSFVFNLNQRISKQMYTAITTYICYSGDSFPNVSKIGAGDSINTALTTSPKYKSTNRIYINGPLTWSLNGANLNVYCGAYYSIIQPNEQSNTFHIRMDGVNNSNIVYFLMGYDLESLGNADSLTAAELDNIIKNSGLATASSVQEVNNAVKEIKQEANDINNSINNDDVNDSQNKINGFFNDFSSGDDKGLQDIITMPLKYVNDLGKSCKPVNLPLGKLGNVDLPCLSTSVYKISWLSGIIRVISVIINGLISYKVVKSLLLFIHDLRDPDNDKVEVLDL